MQAATRRKAPPLAGALTLAATALRPPQAARTPDAGLRLELPSIGTGTGAGQGALPDAATLRVLAALYLFAEHE